MTLSLLPYTGSKRMDIKFYEDRMPDPKDIDISVELFGGSGYNSLYLFSKNNKIKSIINDNDEKLINFFNEIKKNSDLIIDEYNYLIDIQPTKEDFLKLKTEFDENKSDNARRAILYLFFSKYHGMRKYLYPTNRKINKINKKNYDVFLEWLKNTEFIYGDYKDIYTKISQDKEKQYFIFLDPPYLSSFNSYYSSYRKGTSETKEKIIIDNTEMYIDILKYLETSEKKILLIINKFAITEYIYKKYVKGEYNKTYQITKKKTQHLIINNYE
jgi:site-specific DNA-adenine methylase